MIPGASLVPQPILGHPDVLSKENLLPQGEHRAAWARVGSLGWEVLLVSGGL